LRGVSPQKVLSRNAEVLVDDHSDPVVVGPDHVA
jgi:hypothetical protein